jgi:hypothetical protein
MKETLLFLSFFAASTLRAATITNLVEILPRLEVFGRAMNLDIPQPLTISNLTLWIPYHGPLPTSIQNSSVIGIDQHRFTWNALENIVDVYMDPAHRSYEMYRHHELTPDCLLAMDKGAKVMTTNEVIAMAERLKASLASLGHKTNWCGKVRVTRAQWKGRDLPLYDFDWQWTRVTNDVPYMRMEIDALRGRLTSFFTLQGSPAEQGLDGKRMPWDEELRAPRSRTLGRPPEAAEQPAEPAP